MEKNNNKLVVFLLIVIICLMLGGGFLALQLFKEDSNSNINLGESNSSNNQLDGESNNSNTDTKTLVTYDEKNVPQVNLDVASEFNKKVRECYSIVDDATLSSAIKDNIAYFAVTCYGDIDLNGVSEDGEYGVASFIYDLTSKQVKTVKDILAKYNMGIKEDGLEKEANKHIYIMPTADGLLEAYPLYWGAGAELYYK